MKLYYVKSKLKRFRPLGLILANHLNLKLNILDESNIIKLVHPNDIVYFEFNINNIYLNKCYLIGSEKIILNKWNNKIFQYEFLKNIIKIPSFESYKNIFDLIIELKTLKKKYKKFIIFEAIGESGENCLVCNESTLNSEVYNKFRLSKNNFRVSEFISNVHNISLHFIIADKNSFWISPIVDQIIENDTLFKGGIYPSIISDKIKNKVIEETSKIAEVLSMNNYVGLCHVDFMISNGDIFFTEINPRKAGTTPCMSYMMENCFNYSIPIIEYYAVKEKIILDIKRIKSDINWKLELVPFNNNNIGIPGDERKLFILGNKSSILYNEFYNKHSFKVIIK